MTDNYIGIMIESLRRKKDVLTDILKLSEEQSLLLDDPNLEPDTFEKNVNRKAALIDKLEQLDTGFESLYDKVKEELESNRDIHKEQIRQMQELIRALTELNMQIQATEQRQEIRKRQPPSLLISGSRQRKSAAARKSSKNTIII